MSLDVYLEMPGEVVPGGDKIVIREDGAMREISRDEWDELHPGLEPVMCTVAESNCVYEANITHNMADMAGAVGLYCWLWRPDENGVTKARQLIKPLQVGLVRLIAERKSLLHLNPDNGWGNYDQLVEFTRKYLAACEDWPDADVRVWR